MGQSPQRGHLSRADDKLARVPRLVREGRLKDALTLAANVLDVVAGPNASDLRGLSPDSLLVLRDLLDAAAKSTT